MFQKTLTIALIALFSAAAQAAPTWFTTNEKFECIFSGQTSEKSQVALKLGGLGDGLHADFQRPDAPYVWGGQFAGGADSDLGQDLAMANILVDPSSTEQSATLMFMVGFDGKKLKISLSKSDLHSGNYQVLAEASATFNKFNKLNRKLSLVTSLSGLGSWNGSVSVNEVRADCYAAPFAE